MVSNLLAHALLDAERRFRRINNCKDIEKLTEILKSPPPLLGNDPDISSRNYEIS